MSRELIRTESNRPDAASPSAVYLVYSDGHVIAYGRERDAPRPNLWIASLWKGHPLDDEDATHVEHLAADSTWGELQANIKSWVEGRWPR